MPSAAEERAVAPLPAAPPREAATPCAACGCRDAVPRYAIEGRPERLVICTTCGTGRLDPMPGLAQVAAFYPEAYYGVPGSAKFRPWVEAVVRRVGSRHVRFLLAGLAPGARVLDVGCGRGVLLGAIAERGFEAHGVEISEAAARGADPRARIRIAPRLEEAGYPEAHFDEVIVWHVLEHLPDPRAALAAIHRVLRPAGRLVVAVPNFASLQARWAGPAWFHLDLPRHLHHFPLRALLGLLEQSGFRPRTVHHFSLRQNPFGWVQSALNRDPSLPRNGLYTLLHEGEAAATAFDARTRRSLLARGALLAPLGAALAALETALRSGGTVHVVADRTG